MQAPATIAQLYGSHHHWLRGWLRRQLGNTTDAADLAHDTFVRLLASRRPAAELGAEPRALLAHIARGLVIDHWRRRDVERAYLAALGQLPEAQAPSPEARLMILETLYRLEGLLRGLPARTREIFLLSQLDGLRYREIATRLALSEVTVKRHMRAAFAACLALS